MWVQRFIFVRLNLTQFRNVRNFEGQCDSGITWHTDTHQKLVHRTPQSTTWTRFTVSSDIQRAKEGTLHYILRYSGWMFWQVLETKHNKGSATINEMTKLAEESIYLLMAWYRKLEFLVHIPYKLRHHCHWESICITWIVEVNLGSSTANSGFTCK